MKYPVTQLCRFSVMLLFVLFSCSEEETPIPLQANAGEDIDATVATVVTLDGSTSTGPEGFSYQWTYTGGTVINETELSFTDVNSAKASFTPPKNGSYSFTLRIEHNGKFSEDQISVGVTGVLTLPATITSSMVLQDIEPDPTKPDYQATGLVTITAGVSTLASPGSLNIQFAESAGLVVQSGNVDLSGITLTSVNGWKGILLSGGSLTLQSGTKIDKAGKSAFEGQTETASLVMTGGSTKMIGTFFTSSMGAYDMVVSGGNFTEVANGNSFSASKPIKMNIAYVSQFQSNSFPETYDHIVLTTPGAGTVATTSASNGFQFYGYKYLIDGDFTAGSIVHFNGGANVFMKEGAGILQSSGTISSNGSSVIDGLNSAPWKGIAIGASAQVSFGGIEIKNAGSSVFNTGAFTSSFKAAIYFTSTNGGQISNSKITDSKGYGIYMDTPPGTYMVVNSTVFTNPVNAAINVLVSEVYRTITSSPNTYTMPAGVPAVEVRSPNINTQPVGTWYALGGSNYYLFTGNVVHSNGTWILSPGVSFKFKAGKYLSLQNIIKAEGTADQPIIFDSEAGTSGTWSGMIIESQYFMQYCQIKNGGENFVFTGSLSPATEKANIVFNYGGTSLANIFKNNTITGSAGYGILVEDLKQNPDAENAANSNTFSNNVSGNVVIK